MTIQCDGVRQAFTKVDKLSQYDPQKSIDDQKFMHLMKEKVGLGAEPVGGVGNDVNSSDGEEKPVDPNALRYTVSSSICQLHKYRNLDQLSHREISSQRGSIPSYLVRICWRTRK